jgi:NAD(P)-dependent dehydrogenase (short-subunit alcohol dehydrogenase family)
MNELRFDGRTAIVTGAGGNPGLGRAHALLLAARGANVVVNDIGRLPTALGYAEIASAEAVAEEIRVKGGKAVADTHSVATQEGAAAVIQTALQTFGSADIVVNNAAICVVAPFETMTAADFRLHVEVNLLGSTWMCRAVWPHMRAHGYGRIVNVSSMSMAGFEWQAAYAASKGGVFSLTRALAAEGSGFGIRVNTVFPGAFTRMVSAQQGESSAWYQHAKQNLPAELVSPAVAFLAHESCPVTGEGIECIGGEVHRIYLARTPGFCDRDLTIESLARRWPEVMSGFADSIIGHEAFNPREWSIKPYEPIEPANPQPEATTTRA